MRQDSEPFRSRNAAAVKYPRIVVKIEFEVESIYLTSHDDILDIPGVVIEGVLQDPNATSQRIVPDEARSEIGSFAFSLIDKDSVFTNAIRTRLLDDGYGLRGKTVSLYLGYAIAIPGELSSSGSTYGGGVYGSGSFGGVDISDTEASFEANFADFRLFQTQIVTGVAYDAGVYRINCADITREQRADIFEPKTTTLAVSLTDSATTVEAYDTSKFQPVAHGTSYSDSPSATVGYIKIDKEIIKYTAKTPTTFTGCTRGALNTKAVAHTFETSSSAGRRPKIEEYIYIEEPCAKIGYKILTGKDPLTGLDCWPEHWNLGIDPDLITITDFTGIGADLWNPADDAAGFVAYFSGLKKVTGKRFLESEIYVLLGCYSPIYADGTIGLKRMNQVLADSASVVTLDEDNCVSWSELQHEYGTMHNRIRIDWNWNGEEFTRTTLFIDAVSIGIHGEAPIKTYQFKGLHGSRHTDSVIRKRIDCIRDRYSQPPETMSVSVLPSLNVLEIGDIVRNQLSTVRDFAAEGVHIDRSFEIQQGSYNWANGTVSFDVFGSTARADVTSPTTNTNALPSTYYTDRGTNLTSVTTIVVVGGVGIIQAGTYNLTGHADINNSAAVYYYDGDLQLDAGATLTINNNVQIRHNGFFQINGTIDGIGRGQAGVASSGAWDLLNRGMVGFVGNTRGSNGILLRLNDNNRDRKAYSTDCALTEGLYGSFPFIDIAVDGDDIVGIPNLFGTSGGGGGKNWAIFDGVGSINPVVQGGTGGNSGAGLCLVGRGLGFGGSGFIDLSGDDGTTGGTEEDISGVVRYAGAGAGGGPGSLFIMIDGGAISLPDLGGHFSAVVGNVPVLGNPMTSVVMNGDDLLPLIPVTGAISASTVSNVDLSNVAHRIQYLAAVETPQEDSSKPAAPTALSASGSIGKVTLSTSVVLIPGDRIEYYAATTNDRTTATRVGFGAQSDFVHSLAAGGTRYYWVRVRRVQPGVDLFSEWYPSSATGGVTATSSTVDTDDITPGAATSTYSASDAGPDTYNAGTIPGSPGYYLSISGSAVPTSSTVRATLTCSGIEATAGANGSIFMVMDWGAGNQSSDIAKISDQVEQTYVVQKEFTGLPAATAWTLTVRIGESGTASTTYTNTQVLVEVIKR